MPKTPYVPLPPSVRCSIVGCMLCALCFFLKEKCSLLPSVKLIPREKQAFFPFTLPLSMGGPLSGSSFGGARCLVG